MPHSLWRCAIVIVSRRAGGGDGRSMELYISPVPGCAAELPTYIGCDTHSSNNSSISTSLVAGSDSTLLHVLTQSPPLKLLIGTSLYRDCNVHVLRPWTVKQYYYLEWKCRGFFFTHWISKSVCLGQRSIFSYLFGNMMNKVLMH